MKKIAIYSIILCSLLLAFSAHSFFTFIHHKETARIHKLISEFQKNNMLSGVIVAGQNGKVIYQKAFGFANNDTKKINSISSEFLLASITKTYTATAILLLAQKGYINLQKPVSTYLPATHPVWQGKMPESMKQVTIHHLLTHSSGLPDYEKIAGHTEWYKKLHSPQEVIQFFAQAPQSFIPGAHYDYQGSNYLLLGLIIETITDKSYETFLQEQLFKPLKLSHTFAFTNTFLSDIQKKLHNLASGYRLDRKTKQLQPAQEINMSVDYAESSIISNALDLFTFIHNLFSNKIINAEMVQKMTTSYLTTSYEAGVGYGVYIDNSLGYITFNHPGKIDGYESIFLYEPQKKITVIILSNVIGSNIFPLAYELIDSIHAN